MRNTPELVDDPDDSQAATDDSWTVEVEGTPNRFPWLAKLGIALGMLALLFVSALALGPMVLPASMTVSYAESLIGRVTGVDVTIKGDHAFSILPSLRLEAENVVSKDEHGAVTLALPHLELEAGAFGVLAGSVDLQRVMLRDPRLQIETHGAIEKSSDAEPKIDRAWGWWRDMTVKDLDVENAAFVLSDRASGRALRLERFNLSNVEPGQGQVEDGLIFNGKGLLNGEEITLSATTSDPQLLVSGNRWPFRISLDSALLNGAFKGSMAVRERTVGEGEMTFESSDVTALNDWLGPVLPGRDGGHLSLTAHVDIAGDTMDIRRMELTFGDTSLTANMKIDGVTSGAPVLSGRVDASTLDLGAAPAGETVALMEAPLMIPGMPSGRMEFAWQRALWRGLEFGAGDAVVERAPGTQRLSVSLEDTVVYGGTIRGTLTLDASEGMRALSMDGRAVGVDIGPMMRVGAVAVDPLLSGQSNIELNLFSVGGSRHELLEALTGELEVVAQNGSLAITELVRGLAPEADGSLRFKSLNATFRFAQGIAASDDLLLQSGDLSLVGKGRIDLANWTIDLDIGRLGTDGQSRTLKRYRVSGPANEMRVEPINGS
ncbi:MAG: AsmA family protein [Rhodospirillales bacterium]